MGQNPAPAYPCPSRTTISARLGVGAQGAARNGNPAQAPLAPAFTQRPPSSLRGRALSGLALLPLAELF
jgi:hypothetical protein